MCDRLSAHVSSANINEFYKFNIDFHTFIQHPWCKQAAITNSLDWWIFCLSFILIVIELWFHSFIQSDLPLILSLVLVLIRKCNLIYNERTM